MTSISFAYEKNEAINITHRRLLDNGYIIKSESEINNGKGYKFCIEPKIGVIIYFKANKSTKIVIENADDKIVSIFVSETNMDKTDINDTPHKVNVSASFKVSRNNFESVRNKIIQKYSVYEERDDVPKALYQIKVKKGKESLSITQYLNGSILLQGVDSPIVDSVKGIINGYDKISFEDNALTFVPDDEKEEIKKVISHIPVNYTELCAKAKSKLTENLYNYLFESDQMQILSALGVVNAVKQASISIPLYNPIIYPFSKVFEGFVLKMMLDKCAFTYEQYIQNPEIAKIGNFLREKKFKKYVKDEVRDSSICDKLNMVWVDLRCHELHSDPARNQKIKDLESIELAENKIGEICSCMLDAYRIIIENGYTEDEMIALKNNEPQICIAPQRETKDIPAYAVHIGTDESGKGDYFGPLVIAGVCVDQSDEEKLRSIGVQDSKKNSDSRNISLANKIWGILGKNKISIVGISPVKYNALYEKMDRNLNNILAWGHARAIENLLENNDPADAVADQFGNETLIKSSLLEKGKMINLFQTPKAERDIGVAAASILARCRYLETLEKLKESAGFELNKGASLEVEKQARRIVEKYGKVKLSEYAKIHFKTTKKVLGE